MSGLISNKILDYAGDYKPGTEKREKAKDIVTRFAIEQAIADYQVTNKATEAPVPVKVTRFVTRFKEYYSMWDDAEPVPRCLGTIKIEMYTRLPCGRLRAPSWGDHAIPEWSALQVYARGSAGMLFVDNVDSWGRKDFSGAGTGLIQMAVERSEQCGFGRRVLLESVGESPGFYRKCFFTTGSVVKDRGIDEELENPEPDTARFKGYMSLDAAGRERYQGIIARKAILALSAPAA